MTRSYFDAAAPKFIATDSSEILGILAAKEAERGFAIEPGQSAAWAYQIKHLKRILSQFKSAHVFFEFSIPRMGRRADVIILLHGMIFVLEYKVGQTKFLRHDIEQTVGYALDLSHFHETSHDRMIIPVLIATGATAPQATPECEKYPDNVATVVRTNEQGLAAVLSMHSLAFCGAPLVAAEWSAGRFKPTPTIVEAAQALYRHHKVEEITRNEAGAENLSVTSKYIEQVISDSRQAGIKSICFVTGVPGSGKTLAGLTIANSRMDAQGDNHAVFLSGNGPLVSVLREALTQDRLMQEKREASGRCKTKAEVEAATHAFIQNIHHYRDENIRTNRAPVDRIAVFDEAQRAWNAAQTTEFMRKKRGQLD